MGIHADDYATVTASGATSGVAAPRDDDGVYHPSVAELDPATGDVRRVLVDPETTDEGWLDARGCLLRAMAHVVR